MKEIVRVSLENEMDLILAHKKVMKLGELTGFSLMAQTSLATAVSEIARCAIEHGEKAVLIMGIESFVSRKFIKTIISDSSDFSAKCGDAFNFARRLIGDITVTRNPKEFQVAMQQQLSFPGTFTTARIDSFVDYFKTEPPLSAYDEIRKKNLLLQDFADKLKESEDDYRTLTDSLPLMMFAINTRGIISYSNKWIEQFLGVMPREINSEGWQTIIHPDDVGTFKKNTLASLQKIVPFKGEFRLKEKSTGNFIWHMVSFSPLKNEKEKLLKWIGFMVDINANKLAEKTLKDNKELIEIQNKLFLNQEELQVKIAELNRSNYELEQFAHLATHDLQEPLRKLFYYSDALQVKFHEALGTGGVSMLKNMRVAAGRMKELITDLLSYSQLNKQQIEFTPVNLNEILQEVVKDLEVNIQEKNALIEIGVLPDINGNALRLRQLFTNLIANSLKYSRPDHPPRVQIISREEEGEYVLNVKDNGIGFEEEYKEKIFGMFERLHTKDKFPGTGIGLPICRKITELHGGSISADSVIGESSIFEIKFPATRKG